MFAVLIFLVYFTFLWMLLMRDEPTVVVKQQEKPSSRRVLQGKFSKVPQQVPTSSVQTIFPPTTLASSKVATEDLEKLGIRELRELSRGRVRGFMKLKKSELVQALQYDCMAS